MAAEHVSIVDAETGSVITSERLPAAPVAMLTQTPSSSGRTTTGSPATRSTRWSRSARFRELPADSASLHVSDDGRTLLASVADETAVLYRLAERGTAGRPAAFRGRMGSDSDPTGRSRPSASRTASCCGTWTQAVTSKRCAASPAATSPMASGRPTSPTWASRAVPASSTDDCRSRRRTRAAEPTRSRPRRAGDR